MSRTSWPGRFAAVLVALAVSSGARAQEPDFTNVNDILNGQWQLLRVDDFVYTFGLSDLSNGTQPANTNVYATTNSQFGDAEFWGMPAAPSTPGGVPYVDALTTVTGRFFDYPNDQIATVFGGRSDTQSSYQLTVAIENVFDVVNAQSLSAAVPTQSAYAPVNAAAVADFNLDGFDEIVSSYGSSMIIGQACNPNATQPAFTSVCWGAEAQTPGRYLSIAAGDFNGDGYPEVAGAYITSVNGKNTLQIVFHTVDPSTLTLSAGSPTAIDITDITQVAIAAGNFDTDLNDELFVAYGYGSPLSSGSAGVAVIDVSNSLVPTLSGTTSADVRETKAVFVDTGRVNWFGGGSDQGVAAFSSDNSDKDTLVALYTVNTQLLPSQASSYTVPEGDCFLGLKLGNFDQADNDANLEIGTVKLPSCGETCEEHIYDIDPSTFALTEKARGGGFPTGGKVVHASFAVGDMQARSVRVGAPTKIEVNGNSQAEIVLGVPPMHVDWVVPVGNAAPTVLNLSAVPDGFFSQYQTSVTEQDQSSRMSTTSYTNAFTETAGAKVTIGAPKASNVMGTFNLAFSQTYGGSVAKTNSSYTGQAFNAAITTGFSDHLWFTSSRQNLYLYPVIGQNVCPLQEGSCSADQEAPLYYVVSGPDMVTQSEIDGANVEWYQPVWEPGNVFSYPWSESLLTAQFPAFSPLTADPPPLWYTDSSTQSQQANWSAGQGSTQTTGSTSTQSYDVSVSVTGTLVEPMGSLSASIGFEYNRSDAVATLHTSSQMVGQSTGVGISKPGTFADPDNYQYAVQTFIFGQDEPPGTVQEIPLNTDIKSSGPLRTAFTADPTNSLAGAWWKQTYTMPDVALNHPARWSISEAPSGSGSGPNCAIFSATSFNLDCAQLNAPDPMDLATSEFYWMRGFFITPADAAGQGPQNTVATAGDQLSLQARVYNYSLTDVPSGTAVHVRFYGQPWDNSSSEPMGSAFLINEIVLDPIPGFNSASNQGTLPNWVVAGTTFDTTPYANFYLVFWVVVWVQDGDGGLVAEMPAHGLTSIPGTLGQIGDVPIETFSNNVGYYNQPLFVLAAPAPGALRAPRSGDLSIDSISAAPPSVRPGEKTAIDAVLRTGDVPLDSFIAIFSDGDPQAGGRAFDLDHVPYVRAHDRYRLRVPFRTTTCGAHDIVVSAAPGHAFEAHATIAVQVACETPATPTPTTTPTATATPAPPSSSGGGCAVRRDGAPLWPMLASLCLLVAARRRRWRLHRNYEGREVRLDEIGRDTRARLPV